MFPHWMHYLAWQAKGRNCYSKSWLIPSLANGITDAITPDRLYMLYGVAKTNPALIDTLFDPDSVKP